MKLTRTIWILACTGLAAACAGRAPRAPSAPPAQSAGAGAPPVTPALQPAQPTRAQPPAPLPPKPVSFPAYHERTLSNGASVILVENHEQPVVSINLRIRSGSVSDRTDKAGVAAFAADLLDKGTRKRNARQIAESIDFVGGSLDASAGADWSSVGATVLSEFLDTALVLLSDVVLNPTFPADELETERKRTLSALQVELSQPGSLAQRRFLQEVYGRHPYGRLPTPETVNSVQRDDLQGFHRLHYRPENALFVVAGDVNPEDMVARLEKHFGNWSAAPVPRPVVLAAPQRQQREVYLIHKPGSVQAVIRVGHLAAPATHPDWVTLDVALQILGGGSTGWLYKVLRETKGYTYGAYASGIRRPGPGIFLATAEVRNEVTDSAMTELFNLLRRIRDEPVPEADLKLAKDFLTGKFPRDIETPQQVAEQVASTVLLGLPREYLETYRDRAAAVSAADVQRVTREHLDPERAAVVVVGDATRIREKLAGLGTIHMFDVDGKPLELADIEVRAAALAFDPAPIKPQTLVYTFLLQGNPMGDFTRVVTRETLNGRDAIRAATNMSTPMMSMGMEVAVSARDLTPLYSRSQQQAGPMRMKTDLRYQGGKIVGTVTTPQGEEKQVNADVVAGTLLPGVDDFVIAVADFEKNKELKLPAFSSQSASSYTLGVKVAGEKKIKTAAGEFDTYELELTGAEGRMRVFVTKELPHVLVRQEFWDQPVAIELKEIK
ncbi:MAG: insulinase family protein [Gemmatimonadetes bacterium]|nr:insulinase family protein [Gemmatimonadota bacterium]